MSLVSFVQRCARTLQYDPDITSRGSIANNDAIPFWEANKDSRDIIPSDVQVLPTLDDLPDTTVAPYESSERAASEQRRERQIVIHRRDNPRISITARTEPKREDEV